MNDKDIFDKVLTIGPDINEQGGMGSVLQLYRRNLPSFHYMRTNSRKGTIAGIFPLLWLLCRLPFARLKGREILHIHTADGKSFIRKSWIMSWGRLWGYKTIYHCHAGDSKTYFEKRGIDTIRKILRKCDATIALSKSWEEYFANTIRLSNIHILNNIVEPADLSKKAVQTPPLKLLFMGKLADNKGIFDLLEVLGNNADNWRGRVHLTVGGVGEECRFNKMVKDLNLSDMVSFVGWISGEKKGRAFQSNDIVILPSYYEGMPICLLEAMANAMPIISTTVGGIPEIVDGQNGILTQPGDKDAIQNAIEHYLNTPEDIAKHGRHSLQLVEQFFPANVRKKLIEIYRSIL